LTSPPPANERSERRPRTPTGGGATASPPRTDRQAMRSIEIPLEHGRWQHLGWGIFGLVAGLLLVLKLGIVGQIIGGLLLAVALRNVYMFTRTLLFESGTIAVDGERVVLPLGLCRGKSDTVTLGEVKHAFTLRRAVPWTRTAPLLIIETNQRAYIYPRDWFGSENDQYRILRTIRHHLGQEAP